MRNYVLTGLFLLFAGIADSQVPWVLKKGGENIKVYTASTDHSKFKMVKVECMLNASETQLAALLLDVSSQTEWVFSTIASSVVKTISPSEIYYYAEAKTPWPLSNRDMVIDLSVRQDPITKIMAVQVNNIDNVLPHKNGKVRVPFSQASWIVEPVKENKIKITYTIRIDPGGGIPAWMVNMFIANAPYESFKKLETLIQTDKYKNAALSFIK